MKIGFIGFGGAAYGLTKGLKQEGLEDIYFFDSLWEAQPHGDIILGHAEETGAVFKESIQVLIQESDIIISCVTGSVALAVADKAAPWLEPRHLFVDVNTASPKTMEAVGDVIEKTGAAFADVAMLGAIPAFLHRVPCLASGNGAKRFNSIMQPHGMDITCVGEFPGQASAIKMFRSVFMKGFLALLMEMLNGTHKYQVDSIVLDSIAKTMEKKSFLETVHLQMAKGVISAEQMSHEMEAVMDTYKEMGLNPVMSSATREKLKWCSQMKLDEHFGGKMPDSLDEILDIMENKAKSL
jgi:3-hydroxyisobutyrate dehydrogenase-like beta-hydroxyacid dehydrogenase